METTRSGGCSCGAVRYEVAGEPLLVGLCHCTACRKESGSTFSMYAKFPLAGFTQSGTFSTFDGRSFCPQCGSSLFSLHDDDVEIRVGSLDTAPTGLTPTQEGWIRRRETWMLPVPGASQSFEDPPR